MIKKTDKERKAKNDELLRKMKAGEPLTSFNAHSSFFPPRPLVKKDQKEIDRIYGDKDEPKTKD